MEQFKKTRKVYRGQVTRLCNSLDQLLTAQPLDKVKIEAHHQLLQENNIKLQELDVEVLNLLVTDENQDDDAEDPLGQQYIETQDYQMKIRVITVKVEQALTPAKRPGSPSGSDYSTAVGSNGQFMKRNFKLPKIELKKFRGDLKEWLGFWSQFKKIDDDDTLHASDKFQYLIQAMEQGTEAKDIVTSYPQTEENYPKAVLALKERYGRENLLMQVYIRELLKLVINNATTNKKLSLNKMYVKLQSHLRALASINLKAQDPSAWLFPLVESSLPEELLRAWQRSPLSKQDGSTLNPPKSTLDFLMEFIGAEVQSEQQIELAQSGFRDDSSQVKKYEKKKQGQADKRNENEFATSSSLFTADGKKTTTKWCLFCGKDNHYGQDCFRAPKMTIEEKRQKIQEGNGCFTCFKKGHPAKNCKTSVRCAFCTKKHYAVMCPDAEKYKQGGHQEIENITEGVGNISIPATVSNTIQASRNKTIMMKTLHVRVSGTSGKQLEVRLLFDEGSQRSYIKTSIAEELKCPVVNKVTLQNQLFGGQMTEFKKRNEYKVTISGIQDKNSKELILTNENVICSSCPTTLYGPWIRELAKKKIYLTDTWSDSPEIQILIGSDLWGTLMTGKSVKLQNGLIAVESIFGWTLSGPVSVPQISESSYAATVISHMTIENTSLKNLWSLETIGITDSAEAVSREDHDKKVKEEFQNNISRDPDGRYVVKLPWISKDISLPSNRQVCEKRLVSATSKLRSQNQYQNYDRIFQDWEKEGIIQVVTGNIRGDEHLLPHRPVFKPDSRTTPVRPVYDASCKVGNNPSLNQCLEKGPNLLELIPSILIRFREKKIGVSSDIRKAFQMLKVHEDDRRYQKFLWWEDPEEKVIKEFEHCRVVFGINASPFMLAAVLEHHLINVKPEYKKIAELVLKSMYVDNCLISVNTEEEYEEFRKMSVSILAEAKMELREWEHSKDSSSQKVTSVLGLGWDKEEDCLFCQVPGSVEEIKITKRSVLSHTAQVFDPIGFTCPAILTPKLLLQESWASELGWDQEWGQKEANVFRKWMQELSDLSRIRIPRCAFGGNEGDSIQLHTFTDASQKAYAAVVFVRVQCNNEVNIQLLQAKSRLAPLEKKNTNRVTIPRLELLGCLIGARLFKSVIESVTIKQQIPCYFWSDSTTALGWIRRDEDWGTFIGNRVREINKLTPTRNWRHVPGQLNPADLPSRGCSPSELLQSAWWEGPAWLKEPEENWPQQVDEYDEEAIAREIKKVQITSVAMKVEQPRFSSYYKNLCVAAWVRRFYNNCKVKKEERTIQMVPTWTEMKQAERDLIYQIQRRNYPEKPELVHLKIALKDDQLFHVETRLQYRDDTEEFRDPILLPKDDPLVMQMIVYIHRSYCHAGTQFVLGKLREKFWISSGRKTVGGIIRKCVNCRRFSAKSSACDPAPLPKARVDTQFAFQTTGVDLAGPILLKGGKKVWIVLYTCALYRGIYLDLVDTINTEDFVDSLEKFCCNVGRPSQIFSDNGTNFVGARNLMKKLQWEKIEKSLHVKSIKWTMNPPTAAWWGGWWERLVRSVKDLLRRMLGTAKLTRLELEKCLCSISYTINNRPLTTLTEDMDDLTPLTPAMFMKDSPVTGLPERELLTGRDLQDSYRKIVTIKKRLRERFRKEYLSNLIQRSHEKKLQLVEVGDVVLVGADNKKRFEWPLGKITELIEGADGKVRVVKVRTANGILTRPLQRIYPLEVSSPKVISAPPQVQPAKLPDPDKDDPVIVRRSRTGREYKMPSRYGQWNQ